MRPVLSGMLLFCLAAWTVHGGDSPFVEAEFEDLSLPQSHLSLMSSRTHTYMLADHPRLAGNLVWYMTQGKGRRMRFEYGSFVIGVNAAVVSDRLLVRAFGIDKDDKPVGDKDFTGVYLLEGASAKPLVDKEGKPFSGGVTIEGFEPPKGAVFASSPFFTRTVSAGSALSRELCELDGLTVSTTPCPSDATLRMDKMLCDRPIVEWRGDNAGTVGVFFHGKFQPLLDANKKPLLGDYSTWGDYLQSNDDRTLLYHVKDTTARLVDLGKDVKIKNVFVAANMTYVAGTKGKSPILFSLADGKAKSVKLPRKIVEALPAGRHISWISRGDFAIAIIGNGEGEVDITFQMTSEGIMELILPSGKKLCNWGGALYPINGHCAALLCDSEAAHDDEDAARYIGALNSKGEITLVSAKPVKEKWKKMRVALGADGIFCFFPEDPRGDIKSCLYCPWPAG